MAQGIHAWSTTAASNANSDVNQNWAEGQTPASLNNSARALLAALAAFYDTLGGGITYGGSANAYTATNASVGAWSAYAEGLIIGLEANHSNTGAATINVDALGAKSIVKGASTALVANDIISGGFYLLRYDGTNFQLIGGPGSEVAKQPLDATLTALAALSWSSGNALVQFTAADTVSLTLAPSVTSITATSTTSAAAAVLWNTFDNASLRTASFLAKRATPANSDENYHSWFIGDSAGNNDEMGRQMLRATSVTNGSEASRWYWSVMQSGVLTQKLLLDSAKLGPVANDGLTLGESGVGFADLFGASGFTFNFNAGNVVLTHGNSTATLEATTGGLVSKLTQVASVSGTLVAATHRNRELQLNGNITLPNSTFAAGDWHVLRADGSNRTITRGSGVTMYVNGVDVGTATIPANQTGGVLWDTASVCYLSGPIY